MTGRPTGRQELCDCGQIFSGTYSGDMHRVGLHHVSIGPDRRRCLTVAEMLDKGMTQDSGGVWRSPASDRTPYRAV